MRTEMRHEIAGDLGDPDGALGVDGSGFRKYGPASVGVARQYCGGLGKVENCQVAQLLRAAEGRGAPREEAGRARPRTCGA